MDPIKQSRGIGIIDARACATISGQKTRRQRENEENEKGNGGTCVKCGHCSGGGYFASSAYVTGLFVAVSRRHRVPLCAHSSLKGKTTTATFRMNGIVQARSSRDKKAKARMAKKGSEGGG